MEAIYCPWEPSTFLFISSNVPLLIHYSHFIAIFAASAISLLVFMHNSKSLLSRLFLLFSILFSIWALLDVILWATNDPATVMFSWSLQVLLEPITCATAFYLLYLYLHQRLPSFWMNAAIVVILLPLVTLLPTTLNLEALSLSSCESIEGPLAKYYTYALNISFIIMIVVVGLRKIPSLEANQRKSARFFLIGLVTFLLAFTSGNLISSFTDDWTLSQYGLFGMPIFASLIAYSIVQFKAFKVEVAGAEILVVMLWALVASLLVVESELVDVIAFITLIFTSVVGFLLIRTVSQEFKQRRQLEELTVQLEKANKRLKVLDKMKSEFVSIASHQLRSPLTSIRGYASMLLEGSYGKVPAKAQQALERISDSSKFMVESVEDYLNVSRIESGNMKYEMNDFNFRDIAEKVVDEIRPTATKKGLLLTFKSNLDSQGIVNADVGKVRQAFHNLINNSIKYTEKGSVMITVSDDLPAKRISMTVSDTGIGMSQETIDGLFAKFSRAKDANKTNTAGTGLGLYVAKQMIEHMGGTICAKSDGPQKGSSFTLELPLMH